MNEENIYIQLLLVNKKIIKKIKFSYCLAQEGLLFFANFKNLTDPEEIQEYLMESIKANCEG